MVAPCLLGFLCKLIIGGAVHEMGVAGRRRVLLGKAAGPALN